MSLQLWLFLSYFHALTIATLLAGLPRSLVGKLQRVQNSAAHLVVRALPHVHITPICRHLHWLPVRARIFYKTPCLCSTPSPPPPLLISLIFYICTLLLDLFAPVLTTTFAKTKGDCAFTYFGPSVWNSLPLNIRNATTINTFKFALKTYLLNLQEFD